MSSLCRTSGNPRYTRQKAIVSTRGRRLWTDMITNTKLRQPCNIMDKLCFFSLVLLAFVLIFLQKYTQGIKCVECSNCNHTGVAENSTCVTDKGYCVSTIVREKVKGKDVIGVTRRCMSKNDSILCMKHEKNIRCCRDHDLCNTEIPELDSGYSITKQVIIFAAIIIGTIVVCILIYFAVRCGPLDQNINTNPLMGSQPSSSKELNNCSRSGSGLVSSGGGLDDDEYCMGVSYSVFYSVV